jgi:hypothetical protein
MAAFGGSEGSSEAPAVAPHGGAAAGMDWDLDVDAFLDDYLKELGPESQVPDQFGNFAIDFAPGAGAPPGVLGAWGPSATATAPVDSTAHAAAGAPTMLTSQLQHQTLESGPAGTAGGGATLQRATSEGVQQPARPSRARKGAGATAAPSVGGRAVSAASRGSRETKKEIDMKKHLALQEKNRRAQRRFRERQKQRVAELEEQVASLQAQLEVERAARAAAPVMPLLPPVAMPQMGGALMHPVPSDSDMQHEAASKGVKREAHQSPRAVVGAQAPSSSSPPASDEEQTLPTAFGEALTLTVREGHPVQLSARELQDMTPAELAKHYKAYVNELAGILVESENPNAGATQERVRRLVEEVCLLCTRTALCNPPGAKHFALTKVDDVPGQPADARVPQIARALDINAQQRRQLSQLRGLFLQKLARIAAERQDINSQLAGCVPGGTSNRAMAGRYLTSHDCARRLRESLREEHILVMDFVSTINKHVLNSQQVAQFMIQSYPWTPDCLALCTWVAAEDGDAEALSMLAAEAQSKQAAAAAAAAQTSSGGSGNTLAATGATGSAPGSATAAAGLPALPGLGGAPMFLPTAFAGVAPPNMFGQPALPTLPLPGGFNPLMHSSQQGGAAPWAAGLQPGLQLQQPMGTSGSGCLPGAGSGCLPGAGSGCLPLPTSLQPGLSGAGSGKNGLLDGLGSFALPISPHVVTMSSAADR